MKGADVSLSLSICLKILEKKNDHFLWISLKWKYMYSVSGGKLLEHFLSCLTLNILSPR